MKVLPNTAAYQPQSCSQGAWLEYRCYVEQEGEYDLTFFMAPILPVTSESHIWIGCQINDGQVVCEDTVECPDELYFNKAQHVGETINDVKQHTLQVWLHAGVNTVRFYHVSANVILERLVLVRKGVMLLESYLGPKESPQILDVQ